LNANVRLALIGVLLSVLGSVVVAVVQLALSGDSGLSRFVSFFLGVLVSG